MTDIFISYSSKNKNIALNVCAKLEQASLKCWIAPRDIKPGEEYAAGIMRGINNCKCMVLIFSEQSNQSRHVLSEVESAFSKSKVIVPFKISDSFPTDSMEYFLKVAHWLDASDKKLDAAVNQLVETVCGILQQPIQHVTPQDENKTSNKKIWLGLTTIAIVTITAYLLFSVQTPVTNDDLCKRSLENLTQQNVKYLDEASTENIDSVNLISCMLPNRSIDVKAWMEPNRSQFMEGDKVSFKVNLGVDAYLAVYVHSMDGSTYLVYPNPYSKAELISRDAIFNVGNGRSFELEIAEPFGIDIVQFIATTDEPEFMKLLSEHEVLEGTELFVANRSGLGVTMKDINTRGIRGIKVVTKSEVDGVLKDDSDESMESKLWGEALILLSTRRAE